MQVERLQVQKKNTEDGDQALGRSRGGLGTKIHVVVDSNGVPLNFEISCGQSHDVSIF